MEREGMRGGGEKKLDDERARDGEKGHMPSPKTPKPRPLRERIVNLNNNREDNRWVL